MFKKWLEKAGITQPQPTVAQPMVVTHEHKTEKPASEEVVPFQMGVGRVGGINTQITKDTAKTVATVASGAFSAVLGVVAVIVLRGKRW
jgi:hypothetical protein